MVELARQLRSGGGARRKMGRGVGRRRGGVQDRPGRFEPVSRPPVASACRSPAAFRAADGLALAASPVFALMALLTIILGDSAGHHSPLNHMALMYLLMSAFHAA